MPRPPRRQLFIHIGAPKTGTTYIQQLLWHNRTRLKRDGVLVPGQSQQSHFRVGRDIRGESEPPIHPYGTWEGSFNRMLSEIRASDCPVAVISDERLAATTRPRIDAMMDQLHDVDVHVIYGVRDLAGLLTSEWQQSVKHGSPTPWEQWLDHVSARRPADWFWRVHDLNDVLDRWSPACAGRIHALILPAKTARDAELWDRFREVVGWRTATNSVLPRSNETLGYTEATLIAMVQREMPAHVPKGYRTRIVKDAIAPYLSERPGRAPIRIPEHHRAWIEQENDARIEVLRSPGLHVVGSLDELRGSQERYGDPDAVYSELEVLNAAGDVAPLLHQLGESVRLRLELVEGQLGLAGSPADPHASMQRMPQRRRTNGEATDITEDHATTVDLSESDVTVHARRIAEAVAVQARMTQRADRLALQIPPDLRWRTRLRRLAHRVVRRIRDRVSEFADSALDLRGRARLRAEKSRAHSGSGTTTESAAPRGSTSGRSVT